MCEEVYVLYFHVSGSILLACLFCRLGSTDSNQRGRGRGITGKEGEGSSKIMYKGMKDKDKGGGGLHMGGGYG